MNLTTQPTAGVHDELLPEGFPVGGFRIGSFLRAGGMAHVYLGVHPPTGTRVAIKVLQRHVSTVPECVARFQREAEVMMRLRGCPNVVELYDAGRLPDGRPFLVMEFVRGQDLDDLLIALQSGEQRMSVERACRLIRDIARGVAAAHHNLIVHRDLKPPNVMIEERRDGSETAKILDFGVSADLGHGGRAQALTVYGSVIGTPGYMAPEQTLGLPAAPSFDIYALGVMLQELLTGDPPPEKGWRAGPPADIRHLRPDVPAPLADLIRDSVVFDSAKRIRSVEAFLQRVEEVLAGPPPSTHRAPAPPPRAYAPAPTGASATKASAAKPGKPRGAPRTALWVAFVLLAVASGGSLAFVLLSLR